MCTRIELDDSSKKTNFSNWKLYSTGSDKNNTSITFWKQIIFGSAINLLKYNFSFDHFPR